MDKTLTLFIIRVGKKLFYNTPVHRSKIVNIVYEKLFHAAFDKAAVVEVPYQGYKFKVPARDITILPSLMNNNYEKHEIALLKRVLKPGMTFVDIGANIGLFSVVGAKAVGKIGKIYCFEPEPGNHALLQENLALNKVNAITEQLAVGAKKATLQLQIEKNSIGTHSLLQRDNKSIEHQIEVRVVKLDDYFTKKLGSIDVLKIDVEGYEPFVLKGAENVLKQVQYLFFEYSKADVESSYGIDKMVKLLSSFPYMYGINEKTQSIKPFPVTEFHRAKYLNILATKQELK